MTDCSWPPWEHCWEYSYCGERCDPSFGCAEACATARIGVNTTTGIAATNKWKGIDTDGAYFVIHPLRWEFDYVGDKAYLQSDDNDTCDKTGCPYPEIQKGIVSLSQYPGQLLPAWTGVRIWDYEEAYFDNEPGLGGVYAWAATSWRYNDAIKVIQCRYNADCPTGQVCNTSGDWTTWKCESAPVPVCTPNTNRCNGNSLEICRLDGSGWDLVINCAYGCNPTGYLGGPGCNLPPVCTENIFRCSPTNPNMLQKCVNGQWMDWQTCTYGCNTATGYCNTTPICTPNAIRCVGNNRVQCNAQGTGENIIETCVYGCNSTTNQCNTSPPPQPSENKFPWWIVLVGAGVAVAGYGLYKHKKRKI